MLVRARRADVGFVLGGALLLVSALLHWVGSGPGSTLRGHALIDTIAALGHTHPHWTTTALTLLWYAVPACGAFAWITVGFGEPARRSGHIVAAATVAVTLALGAYFVIKLGLEHAGPGLYTAAAGATTLAFTSFTHGRRLTHI